MNMFFRRRFPAAISLATDAIDDGGLQRVDDEGRALDQPKLAEPVELFT